MIRKTGIFIIILCISFKFALSQEIPWRYGFQFKYGISNFNLEDINRWIKQNYMNANPADIENFRNMSRGQQADISVFFRPYRYMALSFGFMPGFRASRQYVYSRTIFDCKVKSIPYYLSVVLYKPTAFSRFEPFFSIKTGIMKKATFQQTWINNEEITGDHVSVFEPYSAELNFISVGAGFDFALEKSFMLSLSAGYQFAKVHDLRNSLAVINNQHIIYSLQGDFNPVLDFSGIFMSFGVKYIL